MLVMLLVILLSVEILLLVVGQDVSGVLGDDLCCCEFQVIIDILCIECGCCKEVVECFGISLWILCYKFVQMCDVGMDVEVYFYVI